MILRRARVSKFKSIDDSGWIDITDVTAFVGKNEAGKTTFLQALYKLNPAKELPDSKFNYVKEYPRKEMVKYKTIHSTSPHTPIEAEFGLAADEVHTIESLLGMEVLKETTFFCSRNYLGSFNYKLSLDEKKAVQNFANNLPTSASETLPNVETFADLLKSLNALPEKTAEITAAIKQIEKRTDFESFVWSLISPNLPKFVYFSTYNKMPGKVSIDDLSTRSQNKTISTDEQTFLSLLALAETSLEDYKDAKKYEMLKAQLESASITISDEVFLYWSQNKELAVQFDIHQGAIEDPPMNGTVLEVRVHNNRHRMTVPFSDRSNGFVWFFSFLSFFSDIKNHNKNLILLLDEPGLSLHATAQRDLLKFIEERLKPEHQVLYSTHSPFLIDAKALHRVRTVQDIDGKGTVISADVLKNDKETLFPIQAALGYDLSQTLFVGPNSLLVEGPSDLLYLQLFTTALEMSKKNGLSHLWTVTPCGGADKVSTFVSLLGSNNLNVAVMMDIGKNDKQRIENLQANNLLKGSNLVQLNEFANSKEADIEDLIPVDFYLDLVNGSHGLSLTEADLPQGTRIVKRIQAYFDSQKLGRFNHYLPAVFLLKNQMDFLKKINVEALTKIEALITRLNSILDENT